MVEKVEESVSVVNAIFSFLLFSFCLFSRRLDDFLVGFQAQVGYGKRSDAYNGRRQVQGGVF